MSLREESHSRGGAIFSAPDVREALSHRKHDVEENRSRNATNNLIRIKIIVPVNLFILPESSSREELNHSETFELKVQPVPWDDSEGGRTFMAFPPVGN